MNGNNTGKDTFLSRRKFVNRAGASVLALSVVKPSLVRGTAQNSKIKLGLIGCGGRGTWIADLFKKHSGYEVYAAADYFKDKVDGFGDRFSIPENRRFTGLSCYKRLLEAKVDAVAIESPPYFHPEQTASAINAGVHVYLAKPIAVDVPGCLTIKECGKIATEKKLVLLVDFQTRANEYFKNAIGRVHDGAIGEFAFGESSYHAGSPWGNRRKYMDDNPDNPENRLRAWGLDRALSGDIITEQNIHTLDVASWIMNREPVFAMGTGGHKVRTDKGNCYDHFALVFQYPDNVGITFSSRQFEGYDTPEGIKNRMFGSLGVLETEYGGQVIIRGKNFYRGGRTNQIYQEGAENNIDAFYRHVTEGQYTNDTVEPSVTSNLVTILGRTAAYSGEQVFWDRLLKNEERLEPLLTGLKD
ncbi:Gfo/Idh/MocA family oxidoreductase [candidate division KSB1 bacterium]|nr:Gfo/Idh/MocA family oxidoreductase [candidate division KSB1 bacterium]